MKSICVYCGTNSGRGTIYLDAAREVGTLLANRNIRLVYGGGRTGMMGAVANAALDAGGQVLGIIPEHLMDLELGHKKVTELRVVKSMHERKAAMIAESDGFLALPGGLGTLEEIAEAATWALLGLHRKPCGLLGPRDFWADLKVMMDHMVTAGFLNQNHREIFYFENSAEAMIDWILKGERDITPKWADED